MCSALRATELAKHSSLLNTALKDLSTASLPAAGRFRLAQFRSQLVCVQTWLSLPSAVHSKLS